MLGCNGPRMVTAHLDELLALVDEDICLVLDSFTYIVMAYMVTSFIHYPGNVCPYSSATIN